MNIDEGILTSKSQLPVTQLNYGGSSNRFSWILYKIEFLECHGKSDDGEYPSERNSNRIDAIETDIVALKSRSTTLEGTVFQPDYYFKYYQSYL